MDASDLGALMTLDALLQESSVSRAARRLGLSAPAVSHALARLRERFDDPLLVRAGRAMVLTPKAEALRPQVRDALEAAQRVFASPETFAPERVRETVVLCASDYVMVVFGAPLEARLSAQAPGLDMRVVLNASDDAERLRAGEIDLAVGIYGALPPELKTRPIITDRFVCVVREDHPHVGEALTLEDFVALEHIQVAPRGKPGGYVDSLLEAHGFTRRVARAVPFFQVALTMTARSDRILTVSERIAQRLGPELGLRVIEPPLKLKPFALSMVWHPRLDQAPLHRWFRSQLLEATRSLDGMAHPEARRRLDRDDPTGR